MMKDISILVIDDEQIIRDGAERIINKAGWQVTTAENAQRGLELVRREEFHIILLDLMMPGMSGMDFLKQIRETNPNVIVIVITGYATIENAVEAMKNGAYDFIPKPFTPDQLRIVVKRAIDKLVLEREAAMLRKEHEKGLRDIAREKSRTMTIINHMADGVMVTDHSGCIVLYNPAVIGMLGLDDTSLLDAPITEVINNNELADMLSNVIGPQENRSPGITYDITWETPREKFLSAHAAPVCADDGSVIGAVTIFSDITLLKEIDRAKSDFVDIVSHELRSPLSSIRQQISVIIDGLVGPVADEQLQILTRIQSRLDGHMGMIRSLLDLSRIEAGRLVQQKEQVFITDIIHDALDLIAEEAQQKNITVTVTADSQLAPIHADRQCIETVINNLLVNALKYNQEGGSISIGAHNCDNNINITVIDTGIGIAPENLHRIFDKFFRIRTAATRKVIGSGIGLPLVKAIVEAHNGTISVESKLEKGTTFSVLLPRAMEA